MRRKVIAKDMIYIPFNEWSKKRILAGKKRATSRYKKYGDVGSKFMVDGKVFIITSIRRMRLMMVAYNHYKDEGAENPIEFIEIWKKIHPKRGFRPNDLVYFHEFEEDSKEG